MMDTLETAKRDIRQRARTPDGCYCPCCQQNVKVYDRKLTNTMAMGLGRLIHQGGFYGVYIHVKNHGVSGNGGEFAQLTHWGLIKPKRNEDTDKRCSGWWTATQKGIDFAEGRLQVPRSCETYNMQGADNDTSDMVLKFSDKYTDVWSALRPDNHFKYREMMGYLI